ncbi:hypothetical protein [Pararhodobacter sp. SW119]|uniref:hypothetical protein n=1 Tax=Pararhodobacter sp. SW119 TaxID=2780075 RepID=UPI001ADF8A5C|nr:hypothetical protein [Pararhodobacter sp. SW119]
MNSGDFGPVLRVAPWGPLRIATAPGRDLPKLSRRAQGMLAFLSQQPGLRAERGELADLLWSNRSEAQARGSLRQELAVLRRVLPNGILQADRQSVWLEPARVEVDGAGDGDFLQGFDLPSEGFEDWLRRMRSRASQRVAAPVEAHEMRRSCLAVLPFDDLDGAQDPFADGIVEEISGALSRARDFHVIARQSAAALGGEAMDVTEAAGRLEADYLLQGSVRRVGDRVRIAVQLVRGRDAHTLWSERFDDRIDDLFELQDRIAMQVAGQVSPSVRNAEIERARSTPPQNRSAYDLVLLAYPRFWTLRPDDNLEAERLVSMALNHAADYAPALALKAWILTQRVTDMWSHHPRGERARALDLAECALRHAGNHVPSLVAAGAALAQAGTDPRRARLTIEHALRLDPNNAWGWLRMGWLHQFVGEGPEAITCFDRAERLSPLDPFLHEIHFGRAATLYRCCGESERGIALIEDGLRRFPDIVWPYRMLAVAHARAGRIESARAAGAELLRRLPHLSIAYLHEALPPIALAATDGYMEMLRLSGIPET